MPPHLEYEPVRCKQPKCGAVLNPYCSVDFMSKQWTCPFCLTRNQFPQHYAEHITESNLPAELIPNFTTVEYQMASTKSASAPAFLFLLDACLSEEELGELKDSIQQALTLLPPTALVGLMTYGTTVQVHELSSSDCPKAFVFKGAKDYDPVQVTQLLGISQASAGAAGVPVVPGMPPGAVGGMQANAAAGGAAVNRFLVPVSEGADMIEQILADMQRDPWPKPNDQRPTRCTGAALSVATSLLEKTLGKSGARIMLFMGGPCTEGPGMTVQKPLAETMRGYIELQKDAAPLFKPACAFYKTLAQRAAANGHSIDVFACSLDQIGLLELKSCMTATGGVCVLADTFAQSVFKESFRRMFRRYEDGQADAGNLQMGFAATLEVTTSRDYQVSGAIGPCTSLKKAGPNVSETEIGECGTTAWSLGGIDPSTTVSLFFEVAGKGGAVVQPGKRHHLQIVTYYQHSNGRYRMRVTTTAGVWSGPDPSSLTSLAASFDQEAAAVVMARIAVARMESEEPSEVLRYLDRSLIRLCSRFAEYRKDDFSSFRLSPNFSLFPQFMFHLRRSQFMQTFNMSPDESAYNRLIFCKEDVSNSLVMMQPSLLCYSFTAPPQPVLLDATSVRPDVILLLDTFFHVLIFHGETIASWREQKYQDLPEHEAFRALLQMPKDDAAAIMENRFPVPRYVVCDQHKSQARFLMAKLNPSVTHNNNEATGSAAVFTDDVSYSVFMEHLMKLAVQS
jgi:protein transport protein SEC23